MAGEVTHVVYAARMVTFLGDEVNSTSFWAGTLFPDIRHLGVASRQSTHVGNLSLTTLVGASDFETGMRVHAWIDETRSKFLENANMKEELPWHPFVPHALKLVEDEWLYDRFEDWELIHRSLNKVYDEEIKFVHSKEHVIRWHKILQDYFKKKPDNDSRLNLAKDIGLSEASATEINTLVDRLKGESVTKDLMDQFVYRLESLVK